MTTHKPGKLHILRIEVDGHFRGSPDVPKPWVAQIEGTCSRYGLQRKFIQPMNDWKNAKKAWSGNIYGVVATFALRSGHLFEVSRLRGNSSRRHLSREFLLIDDDGARTTLTPDEALTYVDGGGEAVIHAVSESEQSWVAVVCGLGTPEKLGFVLAGGARRYRLREGNVYEAVEDGHRRLVGVRRGKVVPVTENEALSWLAT